MTITDTHQDLTRQQDTFRAGLEANDWLLPTLGDGVTGLGPQAEDVVQGIAAAARRVAREPVSYTHLTLPTNREV